MILFLKKHRAKIFHSFSWLLISAALFYSFITFNVYNNLFSWHFTHNFTSYASITAALILLFMLFLVARITTDFMSQIISLVIVLLLLVFAINILQPEPLNSGFLARSEPSPLIYRLGLAIVFTLPAVAWLVYPFRYYLSAKIQN